MNTQLLESRLVECLSLSRRPVAITFCAAAPAKVAKFTGSVPSGCTFWRLAAEGRAFYTDHADHYNCAVGCHTHSIALPPEREAELGDTIGFMTEIGYLRPEDIPGIARLPQTPAYVVYAPLADAPLAPDVVLIVGKPGKVMLLNEAAIRAGVRTESALFGRPTCMILPASLSGGVTVSTGCIGNRVYTELSDDDLYVAIPAADLARVVDELDTILAANHQLNEYHQRRRSELLQLDTNS